ncbi:MAG: protein kinase domain-containing protein [Actinomycetota bacterium]
MRTEGAVRTLGDRYELTEEIAHGGMGVVWRGQDTLLGRPVAVKEMFPQASSDGDDRARKRVLREARAAAALHHPGIVTVYDMLEADDASYIVMELLDAESLHDAVQAKGPLPLERAIDVGRQTASALRAAHEHGITHRDVKPGNVLLLDDGRVKLADFGISSVKDDPSLTSTGEVIGSPAFMSPEQAQGEPASARTDLWGLGTTLYFAVEGAPPFGEGEAIPTMRAVVHDAPRPMRLAGSLAPVISALLAKDPVARPAEEDLPRLFDEAEANASTVAGDAATPLLVPSLEGEPTAAEPAFAPTAVPTIADEPVGEEPVAEEPPSHRSWIVAGALAAALAIAAVIGLVAFTGGGSPSPARTRSRHVATLGSHSSPKPHHHADRSAPTPTTPAPAPVTEATPTGGHADAHGNAPEPHGVANGHDGGPPGNQKPDPHSDDTKPDGGGHSVAPAPPTETETPEPTPSPTSTKQSNPLE